MYLDICSCSKAEGREGGRHLAKAKQTNINYYYSQEGRGSESGRKIKGSPSRCFSFHLELR